METLEKGLSTLFKAYDVRGIYPSQLDENLAYQIGRAYVTLLNAKTLVLGRDMRTSGERLAAAVAQGASESGANVIDIGMVTTDTVTFAVAKFGYDAGIMVTASHNPSEWNGMKFCRAEAQAVSLETGLGQVRDWIADGKFILPPQQGNPGKIMHRSGMLAEFAEHCLSFIDASRIKPFKIAIDAGNGMGGMISKEIFKHLPCTIVPLYFEPDGTFPNHQPSPIEPQNMVDLQELVLKEKCDFGVAFDGDADRMFLVDEKSQLIGGDIVTALVGINTLQHYPGEKILYNCICSKSVPEAIKAHGGKPVRSPVGHSLIKKIMHDKDIVFGGEHSGHFYFRNNWFADSGSIALLQCLEVFSQQNKPVSEVIAPISSRSRSGEINSKVLDIPGKLQQLEQKYSDAELDHLDGLTISYPTWWANIRPSNTEPLLRLNVEGDSVALMVEKRDELLKLIRS